MTLRAFAVWLLLMAAEVVHGILRAIFLVPVVGDFRARQIGVFSGSAIVVLLTLLTIRWMRVSSTRACLAIGITWAVMTLVFEISFGRWLGASWQRLLSDYDLVHGGLMPIGLLVLIVSPLLAARLRSARS